MKKYFYEIKIQAGDYEKNTHGIVNADTEEEARRNALVSECHYDVENLEWSDRGVYDWGYEFHYSVRSCTEIPYWDFEVLGKYFAGVAPPVAEKHWVKLEGEEAESCLVRDALEDVAQVLYAMGIEIDEEENESGSDRTLHFIRRK